MSDDEVSWELALLSDRAGVQAPHLFVKWSWVSYFSKGQFPNLIKQLEQAGHLGGALPHASWPSTKGSRGWLLNILSVDSDHWVLSLVSPCSGDHRLRLVSALKKFDILVFDPTERMFKLRAGTELGIWAIVSANTGRWQQGGERKGEKGKWVWVPLFRHVGELKNVHTTGSCISSSKPFAHLCLFY